MELDKLFKDQLVDDYEHFLNIKKCVEVSANSKNLYQQNECRAHISLTFKTIKARAIQYGFIKTTMGIELTDEESKMIEEIVNYKTPYKGVSIAIRDADNKIRHFSIV